MLGYCTMKKIFIIFAIIFSTTAYAKKNDIVIPKYFFANELTKKTCSLKGVHGYGSWGKAGWDLDLAITHVSKKKNPELQEFKDKFINVYKSVDRLDCNNNFSIESNKILTKFSSKS